MWTCHPRPLYYMRIRRMRSCPEHALAFLIGIASAIAGDLEPKRFIDLLAQCGVSNRVP